MLLLETELDRFTEADLQSMLDALPPSWQERVTRKKPLRSRLQSAIGYTLLCSILQEHFGITVLPAIYTDEYGKPFFKDCDLFFSISHCDAAVVCAVEKHPVAVDVQELLHDPHGRLKARIGAPPTLDNRALTALWTQKEASAKLDGRGLRIPLAALPLPHHILETSDHEAFFLSVAHNS